MENPETRRELSTADLEISGRSLLEKYSELAAQKKETLQRGEKLYGEVIKDNKGKEQWRKDIRYEREEDPENPGKWRDTNTVKAVVEQKFTRDKEGRITEIEGTNTDQVHACTEQHKYDKSGNLAEIEKTVTEGDRQGETCTISYATERKGAYTRKVETTTGKKYVNGKLVDFRTLKEDYVDGEGNTVWGQQDTVAGGNQEAHMEWGKKPEDLDV